MPVVGKAEWAEDPEALADMKKPRSQRTAPVPLTFGERAAEIASTLIKAPRFLGTAETGTLFALVSLAEESRKQTAILEDTRDLLRRFIERGATTEDNGHL